MLLKIYRSN